LYYWRVKTNNGGHFSSYSPTRHFFTTWDLTGIPSYQFQAQTIPVFSNPSTGKFSFCGLQKGSRLQITDAVGRLVQEYPLKENSITIDLEGKDKGLYLYRVLNNEKEVQQGKLILK